MALKLYDSLSRSIRELQPSEPDGVFRFYNCGPTVYAPAHIGNFRSFVVNDVIRRLLELEFGQDKVKHVRNLTDVDDKTIKRAQDEARPLAEVTKQWTEKFHADCAALNCLSPHVEPTATGHIKEQVNMIEVLMEKGNAYRGADGSVYFKIDSFPEYGGLSRIKERELKITDDTADSDHKDSVSDFALWKAYKPNEDGDVKWPGPDGAGEGRPGWHIECSAMIKKHLGDTIDLHTGGVDLLFPHHENEIAQSQCCNGTTMARHWYHGEHLLVNGKKMSKSDGTFYTVDDILAKGYSPMALRYALLAGHPRKQLNFTLDSLNVAEKAIKTLSVFRQKLVVEAKANPHESTIIPDSIQKIFDGYWDSVKHDLNTPKALGNLFSLIDSTGTNEGSNLLLRKLDEVLFSLGIETSVEEIDQETATDLANLWKANKDRDLSLLNKYADRLRLKDIRPLIHGKIGYEIRYISQDPETTIPEEITALAEKRWAAKQAKDWPTADALRAELTSAGWSMLDGKDSYKLEPLKK